jgi:fatty acid-binding protein DegV
MKDGGVVPYGRARSFAKGMDQVVSFVESYTDIKRRPDCLETTTEKEAVALAERISRVYKAKPIR